MVSYCYYLMSQISQIAILVLVLSPPSMPLKTVTTIQDKLSNWQKEEKLLQGGEAFLRNSLSSPT